MANDLNQCNFIGRLGKDPEMRYMPDSSAVANLSLAIGSKWKDKATGENCESTEWVKAVAFGKLAEIIGEYLKKGSQIYLSGRVRTRKWQDSNGVDKWTTEIVADKMQMLGSRGDNQAGQQQGGRQQQSQQQSPAQQQQSAPSNNFDGFDDDIPF